MITRFQCKSRKHANYASSKGKSWHSAMLQVLQRRSCSLMWSSHPNYSFLGSMQCRVTMQCWCLLRMHCLSASLPKISWDSLSKRRAVEIVVGVSVLYRGEFDCKDSYIASRDNKERLRWCTQQTTRFWLPVTIPKVFITCHLLAQRIQVGPRR